MVVGATSVNFFKARFRDSDWYDRSRKPWPGRSLRAPRSSRKLLVDSGRLRRSIRVKKRSFALTVVGTDTPYAKAHNEGAHGTISQKVRHHKRRTRSGVLSDVRAHRRQMTINIPQRKFMGNSHALNKQINQRLRNEARKAGIL